MDFSTPFQRHEFPGVDFTNTESLTEQHHLPELDINAIAESALRTGVLGDPHKHYTFGRYADVSDVDSFLEMQIKSREGEESFMALPSKIRDRFQNSPQMLLEFLSDDKNRPEAEKLGLLKKVELSPESPAVGTVPPLDITVPTDTVAGK